MHAGTGILSIASLFALLATPVHAADICGIVVTLDIRGDKSISYAPGCGGHVDLDKNGCARKLRGNTPVILAGSAGAPISAVNAAARPRIGRPTSCAKPRRRRRNWLWSQAATAPVCARRAVLLRMGWVGIVVAIVAVGFTNTVVLAIGANKAVMSNYIRALLTAVLAILILGEKLEAFHLIAFVLVAVGVLLLGRFRKPDTRP